MFVLLSSGQYQTKATKDTYIMGKWHTQTELVNEKYRREILYHPDGLTGTKTPHPILRRPPRPRSCNRMDSSAVNSVASME